MALIICKECNKQVSDQAAACPNCGSPVRGTGEAVKTNKSNPAAVKIVAAIVVLLGILFIYQTVGSVSDQSGAVRLPPSIVGPALSVTMAEYNQIQQGMTYAQVQQIIGAAGQELSRSDLAGFKTIMYSWTNSNGSNMNAMFQNDALVNKAQFGLP